MGPDREEIEAAIGRARVAVSSNMAEVARDSGIHVNTIKAYEGSRDRGSDDPRWIVPIQYLHYLAGKNDAARAEVLALLGIAAPHSSDIELQRRLRIVENAYRLGVEVPAVRRMWEALESIYEEFSPPGRELAG